MAYSRWRVWRDQVNDWLYWLFAEIPGTDERWTYQHERERKRRERKDHDE